jgi:hypothetical protein
VVATWNSGAPHGADNESTGTIVVATWSNWRPTTVTKARVVTPPLINTW